MASYTVNGIAASNVSINDGTGSLSGGNQGSGVHLQGAEIVITAYAFESIAIEDNDANFEDSDGSQRLDGEQTFFGETYGDNRILEAEYELTVEDSAGNEYTLIGVNVREPGAPNSFGTIEGLAFVGPVPPVGETLTVTDTSEGPRGGDTPYASYTPCFATGTLITTPNGQRAVETLGVGDLVTTMDHGAQALCWVGQVPPAPASYPVCIRPGALGAGPTRTLVVSPQHRMLVVSDLAAVWFDAPECLVAAKHLVGRPGISMGASPVGYHHLLCARHEILFASDTPTESLLPGPVALNGLGYKQRREVMGLLPRLPDVMAPARPILKAWEARLIAA